MTRPNILLLMADQLAAQYLPIYGHPIVRAPALQQLADRGTVFDSAYTNSPLCGPARMAMMSGQRNSRIAAYDNASEFAASIPTFAHHLRTGGYQTCLAGKMHFVGPDQLHGFEERVTTDIYPADFGWTPNWDEADTRFDWWFHNMDSVIHAGIAEATNQLDYDDEVAFRAQGKLRDLARSADDRPWLLTVSFTHPHDPYVMRRRYWDRYEHGEIDMPRVGRLPVDAIDPHSRRLRNVSAMDATEVTDEHVRNARHAYYASVSYVDEQVGLLLSTLDACGMTDDTMVLFTADHGDMLGERGLWYKMTFFEGACRIPLIVSGCGVESGRSSDHVSLVDVLPTLLEVADLPPSDLTDGSSLLAQLHGQREPDRTVFGEYLGEGAIAPILMIRRGPLKFISCAADPPQLFDLDVDPNELVNLAEDPANAAVVAEFQREVEARWDPARLRDDVVADQRARRIVDQALRQGAHTSWDFQPRSDAAGQFMRNHLDLNVVERTRRL